MNLFQYKAYPSNFGTTDTTEKLRFTFLINFCNLHEIHAHHKRVALVIITTLLMMSIIGKCAAEVPEWNEKEAKL